MGSVDRGIQVTCSSLILAGQRFTRVPDSAINEDMSTQELITIYEHVQIDAGGVPIIAGTNMKVVELVMAQLAHGWSPEELHFQHPYLSLGQIHSALAYYWDHKEELDADIERRRQYAEKTRREAGPSPLANKLRDQGLLARTAIWEF